MSSSRALGLTESRSVTLFGRGLFAALSLALGLVYIFHPVYLANREVALDMAPMWVWGLLMLAQGLFVLATMWSRQSTKWTVAPFWTGSLGYAVWSVINFAPSFDDFWGVALSPPTMLLFIAATHVLRLLSEIRIWASQNYLEKSFEHHNGNRDH